MGDRANIHFVEENGSFYLYTHRHGSELGKVLASALDRGRSRWTDAPYLARIIFSEMIKGEVLETTGYGISIEVCDGNSNIYKVDVEAQTVQYCDGPVLTFDGFIEAMARK